MVKIKQSAQRDIYISMNFLTQFLLENGVTDKQITENETIQNYKFRLRQLNKGIINYFDFVKDCGYGDMITKKIFDYAFSEEDKADYINDNWARCCSPYDCSCERFTTDIKIFVIGNKTFVYEWSSLNI